MAIGAFRDFVLRGKLPGVRIRVARFAILRCAFELNFVRSRKRLVAFAADHNAMSAGQRKFCF